MVTFYYKNHAFYCKKWSLFITKITLFITKITHFITKNGLFLLQKSLFLLQKSLFLLQNSHILLQKMVSFYYKKWSLFITKINPVGINFIYPLFLSTLRFLQLRKISRPRRLVGVVVWECTRCWDCLDHAYWPFVPLVFIHRAQIVPWQTSCWARYVVAWLIRQGSFRIILYLLFNEFTWFIVFSFRSKTRFIYFPAVFVEQSFRYDNTIVFMHVTVDSSHNYGQISAIFVSQ